MLIPELVARVEALVSKCETSVQRQACMTHLSFLHRGEVTPEVLTSQVVEYIICNYLADEYESALEEIEASVDYALAE